MIDAIEKLPPLEQDIVVWSALQAPRTGLFLEFGVFKGATIRRIASAVAPVEVFGFDSFEGLPDKWVKSAGNTHPKGCYTCDGVVPLDVPANVRLVKGLFEETLPDFLRTHAGPVSFVNIDCDIYASTKAVLRAVGGRLLPGSVLYFDELCDWTGTYPNWVANEYRALLEWLAESGRRAHPIARNRTFGVTIIIDK